MTLIYHLAKQSDWEAAQSSGFYSGGETDRRDGFIHFSTVDEIETSAALYCKGMADLLLVALNADICDDTLKWETSRDGKQFPHLYEAVDLAQVTWVKPLPLGENGQHIFPPLD